MIEDDLFASQLEPASFDLVHARFQLPPLGRFSERLAAYAHLVRPGGRLALEEPDSASWHFNPAQSAERLIALIRQAFQASGGNFDIARQLPELRFVGVAGEVGHVLSDPYGPICRCGNRGCLESVASLVAVAALLERSLRQPVTVPRLLELVAQGDRRAQRAVAEAGEAVGRAVSMLVNVLNPELVVVGGDLSQAGDILLAPITAAIERHSVAPAAAAVRVTAGMLGPRAEVLGAAALILAKSPRALVARLGT